MGFYEACIHYVSPSTILIFVLCQAVILDRAGFNSNHAPPQRKSWRSAGDGDSLDEMQRSSFKLALAQMLVEGGRKEANLRRAIERIREAAANGAQVVVLPEAMTLGWTDSSAKTDPDEVPDGGPDRSSAINGLPCPTPPAWLCAR